MVSAPICRSAYLAFDPHPSTKGASTHIAQFCAVLGLEFGPTLLLTLGSATPPIDAPGVVHERFFSDEANPLDRALQFMKWARRWLSTQFNLEVIHFRDIWGGMAALEFPHVQTIFEVNGLPSIELPYRYPRLSTTTLAKISDLEDFCLRGATQVITPSHTTAAYLHSRGVASDKVVVIPNGAIVAARVERPSELPEDYMVYVGALQPWQGIADLFRALRYLEDVSMPLVVCSAHPPHLTRPWERFAEDLGVAHRVQWRHQLDHGTLNAILQHAWFSVAPLTECSRNVVQGCSPLKILESMANGTAVIASRLPPTLEIIEHQVDGILCRPDRPSDLARQMRLALEDPDGLRSLGLAAQLKVQNHFTWDQSTAKLLQVYHSLTTHAFPYEP